MKLLLIMTFVMIWERIKVNVMVKSLDKIPYGTMPKWGQTAIFLINTKQKMGLGVNSKNVNRR